MFQSLIKDRVVTRIEDKLRCVPDLPSDRCIYRVPGYLRKVNEDAYRPLIVSIGPYYHDDPKLQPMQDHKLRYLQAFLSRINVVSDKGRYVQFIRQRQQDIRKCYAEEIDLDDDTFVEMVFTDAAFVIEFFLRTSGEDNRIRHKSSGENVVVIRDICIEENQLPFFILNDIFDLAFNYSLRTRDTYFGSDLAYKVLVGTKKLPNGFEISNAIKNFVDLLRRFYLPSTLRPKPPPANNPTFSLPRSVTMLSEAGVKFKVSESKQLLDITFTKSKGVLKIPTLMVDDGTESLFCNIMVFEQCHYHGDTYIIDYFVFLDSLINTTKDVEILVENGIINNCLGSNEEVAILINKMVKYISFDTEKFYYLVDCGKLNAYSKTKWNGYKATLKHKYFNHPWAVISVIYAILILILTVSQVVTGFTNK